MKLIALILLAALPVAAQTTNVSVYVDSGTGVLITARTNFFTKNISHLTNALTAAGYSSGSGGGTGSVTSVGLTMPTGVFDIASSPVTTSGTIAVTFDNQTANTVFAGPTTGSAAAPAFRALVDADIPSAIARDSEVSAAYQPLDADLTALAGISGVRGDILYYGASGWTRLAKGTSGRALIIGSDDPSWSTIADSILSTNVPLLNASSNVWGGDQYIGVLHADDIELTNPVPVESGGTERATLTSQAFLYGNGTGPVGLLLSVSNSVAGHDASGNATNYPISSLGGGPTVVTGSGTSATPDFTAGTLFKYTMIGNFTLNAPTVGSSNVDRDYEIQLIQDSTGGRSLTLATNYQFNGTIAGVTISTNASYTDSILVRVMATNRLTVIGHITAIVP